VRLLVFDFDGLILETEEPEFRSWQELYADYGHELPRARWVRTIGSDNSTFDPWQHLGGLVGERLDRDAARARLRRRRIELLEERGPLPGVERWLDEADALGLRLAIASSSSRRWVESQLDRVGLRERFDWLVTRDDVAAVKPDPALYLGALERAGAAPGDVVALEDSPNGVASARAAGLWCVAVPSEMTRDLCFDAAHLVLGSLAERPLAAVLRLARDGSG
jgi:HAD superfamily hydrolase (TIGR01509 family)